MCAAAWSGVSPALASILSQIASALPSPPGIMLAIPAACPTKSARASDPMCSVPPTANPHRVKTASTPAHSIMPTTPSQASVDHDVFSLTNGPLRCSIFPTTIASVVDTANAITASTTMECTPVMAGASDAMIQPASPLKIPT